MISQHGQRLAGHAPATAQRRRCTGSECVAMLEVGRRGVRGAGIDVVRVEIH